MYEPLVTAAMFTGLRADVLLTSGSILGIMIVIAGVGMIIRVLSR